MKKIIFLLCFLMLIVSGCADFRPNGPPTLAKIDTDAQPRSNTQQIDPAPQKTPPQFGRYDPWPKYPPQIGTLKLKQEYWEHMKEAAAKYKISPYLIQAVCAIESRYDPRASSGGGLCYGLMQLHKDTARKYGVNARNPRENILGGAAVLANLLTKYNGNLSRVLHVYNATCTAAYEREVKKAFYQATMNGEAAAMLGKRRHQG